MASDASVKAKREGRSVFILEESYSNEDACQRIFSGRTKNFPVRRFPSSILLVAKRIPRELELVIVQRFGLLFPRHKVIRLNLESRGNDFAEGQKNALFLLQRGSRQERTITL